MTMWDTLAGNHTVDATGRILTVASNDYTNYCSQAAGDKKSSGKWYYEVVLTTVTDASTVVIGLTAIPVATFPGQVSGSYGYQATWKSNAYAKRVTANIFEAHGPNFGPGTAIGAGTVVGVAVDADNNRIYYSTNGLWRRYNNTTYGSPILDVDLDLAHYSTAPIWPAIGAMVAGTVLTANFAAADLIYDPPSGFLPWYEPIPIPVRATLDQPWAIKTGAELVQPWSDSPSIKTTFSTSYRNASKLSTRLLEVYRSNLLLKSILHQSFGFLSDIKSILNSTYVVTGNIINNYLDSIYNVRDVDKVSSSLQQSYWLTGNISLKTLQTQYVVVDGETVYPTAIDLKSSIDQYGITVSVELPSHELMKKFIPGQEVTVHNVLNTDFTLIVDAYDYDLSFDSDTFKVDLISPAALLDSPYADLINGDYVGMASEICETLAGSLSVTWDILDWYIGDGILSASEETPLSVIRKVVNAVGGRVQSLPNGNILVTSRYPKSCNIWQSQPVSYTVNYATEVVAEQYGYEPVPGYNNFNIQNDSSSDTILRVETEEIDAYSKLVKVYVYPDVVPALTHSGNALTVTTNYNGYVTDSLDEEVEFVTGEASVDGPIISLGSYTWKYRNLGALTYEPTGTLYSGTQGDSLLELNYSTGYYSYTVTTSVLENVQIIVEADI